MQKWHSYAIGMLICGVCFGLVAWPKLFDGCCIALDLNSKTDGLISKANFGHSSRDILILDSTVCPKPEGAFARTSWRANLMQLAHIPAQTSPEKWATVLSDKIGFDLWEVARLIKAPENSDLWLCVSVFSKSERRVYLCVGCDDIAIIYLNGRPVFATFGQREFITSENTVSLDLLQGANELRVLCRKKSEWRDIPQHHGAAQWMLSLHLFHDYKEAAKMYRSRNYHLLDTPIAINVDALRLESSLYGDGEVRICDIDGKEVVRGRSDLAGRVDWKGNAPENSFFGYLEQGDYCEPICITNGIELNRMFSPAVMSVRSAPDDYPWKRRFFHLVDANADIAHDNWWARKLMLSIAFLVTNYGNGQSSLLDKCRASHIQFESYHSHIDGLEEYFRVARHARGPKRTLAVMLPSVGATTRPYLESSEVANIREAEDIDSLAEKLGIDVLWPGIVDVDYGGDLARKELDECLDRIFTDLPFGVTYATFLVGSCSSGITALGYAETRKVSGLMFQSPVAARNTHRWLRGIRLDDVTFDAAFLDPEQTTTRIKDLGGTPAYISFNRNIPGHGTRETSLWLRDALLSWGSVVEDHWPSTSDEAIWGEKLRQEIELMFLWTAKLKNVKYFSKPPNSTTGPALNTTVKRSMLKGFHLVRNEDQILDEWLNTWADRWSTVRGQRGIIPGTADCNATTVLSKCLESSEIELMVTRAAEGGQLHVNDAATSDFSFEDELFGYTVIDDRKHPSIEVFRSPRAKNSLPALDLILDGCSKGAVWKRNEGKWVLIYSWL